MKKRTQIEAELAQLALEIGGKSHSEAAKAVLDLYKGLALLEAEETIEQQLAAAQQDMQSQLRAKIAELQSEVSVPEIDVPHLPLRRLQQLLLQRLSLLRKRTTNFRW